MKNKTLYRPIGEWTGRLILPRQAERRGDGGTFFQIHNAPERYKKLIGKKGWLTFHESPIGQDWIDLETRDIFFTKETYKSREGNNLHPDRLNGWKNVSPLQTIAGGRPEGDVDVLLKNVEVISEHEPLIRTFTEPVQICGAEKALVRFSGNPDDSGRRIDVMHYDPDTGDFNGPAETVLISESWFRDDLKQYQVTLNRIHESSLNDQGWYIFGERDVKGRFTIMALEPRRLLRLEPDDYRTGLDTVKAFIDHDTWQDCRKGNFRTTLLDAAAVLNTTGAPDDVKTKLTPVFKEGQSCFLLHLFGWVKPGAPNPIEKMGITMGHFSFGVAKVVTDPFTGELRWDIEYKQVYAHTIEGIISGSQKWHTYMGGMKLGWMNLTPVSDIIIYHPGLSYAYRFNEVEFKPLKHIENHLHRVMARIRSGGGTGRTFVNMATSCVQDAAMAFFSASREIQTEIFNDKRIRFWLKTHPASEQTKRFKALKKLLKNWENYLKPYKILPMRWILHEKKIDIKLPLPNLTQFADAFLTQKTILPRIAHDGIAKLMAENGALLWAIRSDQIGGYVAGNDPLWPTTFDVKHKPEDLL